MQVEPLRCPEDHKPAPAKRPVWHPPGHPEGQVPPGSVRRYLVEGLFQLCQGRSRTRLDLPEHERLPHVLTGEHADVLAADELGPLTLGSVAVAPVTLAPRGPDGVNGPARWLARCNTEGPLLGLASERQVLRVNQLNDFVVFRHYPCSS